MVAGALPDLEGPVDLLQQHDPGQVVGEGHGGHGQLDLGLRLDGGVQAVGAADEKDQVLGGALLPGPNQLGQLLAGAHPALYAQGGQHGAGGQLGPDGRGLPGQGLVDLALRGSLGQFFLRQLHQGEPAIGGQPLDVLGAGLLIEFFLQLTHADEIDAQHRAASSPEGDAWRTRPLSS